MYRSISDFSDLGRVRRWIYLVLFFSCFHRGLFIIDDKKFLRQITMNDLPVGRSVDETLRLVQAFQYTDRHGEGIFPLNSENYSKAAVLKLWVCGPQWVLTKFLVGHEIT